ncbi:putative N-acetyltransferase domain-containing protein [Phytophthora infestans]|uniref:Putative N-acetyltransferase domain-containing protein n=1 Tax=Phytophthora infestans TaxID=4787 RepID=A0A833SR32_PHYIN|nr:putative N-acetyltransferase domain-containing protein [Phytophthora infestans]KAF4128355.1 putative N-acetyltransferase domain-containing protein [Phytophthora infestans]
MRTVHEIEQPFGCAMEDWTPPRVPPHVIPVGRYCQLEPLNVARHARDFWDAQSDNPKGASWTNMINGSFED